MNSELSTEVSPEIINSLILTGDMSKLTPAQQTQYYTAVCKSVGINPLTQPFAIIVLQGKKTLYATKGCTQQLSDSRKINTEITHKETIDGVYVASCRAKMPDGRFTDDIGAVSIGGLKGTELANAMMKSITKAKRRAVLALCGLGMPDETEIDDTPNSLPVDQAKSRVEQIIDAQVEPQQFVTENDLSKEVKEDEKIKPKTEKEQSKKQKEAIKKEDSKSDIKSSDRQSDPSIKSVIGLIDNTAQGPEGEIIAVRVSKEPIINPNTGIASIKHSFLIEGKYYGTWDASISQQIMECVDNRILVKFEYKERPDQKTAGKFFNDIISFKQATTDDVKI